MRVNDSQSVDTPLVRSVELTSGGVPASSLGHHYQSWWALDTLIDAGLEDPAAGIRIEYWDDVSIESAAAVDLINTKARVEGGVLTDKSVDLWKSLRLWMNAKRLVTDVPLQRLCLATTQAVQANSGASLLRPYERNVHRAQELLTQAAESSTNADNKASYKAYLQLSVPERRQFLSDVYIIDETDDILVLQRKLKARVRLVVGAEFVEDAFRQLIGWWEDLVTRHLKAGSTDRLTALMLNEYLDYMRERFGQSILEVDPDIWDLAVPEDIDTEVRILIEQLRLIATKDDGVRFALKDYHRAYVQCGRWVEDGLLRRDELARYEARLKDEWQRYVAFNAPASVCASKTENELIELGQMTHRYLTERAIPLRKGSAEPMISRGSYYALSNKGAIGWHPHFVVRLGDLLRGKSA